VVDGVNFGPIVRSLPFAKHDLHARRFVQAVFSKRTSIPLKIFVPFVREWVSQSVSHTLSPPKLPGRSWPNLARMIRKCNNGKCTNKNSKILYIFHIINILSFYRNV
jgi:hypothetical protein